MFTMMTINIAPHMVPSAILYIVTGDGRSGTPIPETSESSLNISYFSLFNIYKKQHIHHHRYIGNYHKYFTIAGFCVAVVGAIVAYESIEQTRIQKAALLLNTKIHDKSLLDRKVITLEQYLDRHPGDKSPQK